MNVAIQPQKKAKTVRHYIFVMTFVVVIGLFFFVPYGTKILYERSVLLPDSQEVTTLATTSLFARSLPVQLYIPSLDIRTSFVAPLGLEADQTISVPDSYTKVGWYKHGATPGEIGPAVILGHVDSNDGPAIFYSLGQLKIGEEIEVKRADGTTAVFVVESLERVDQDNFPTAKVYGATDEAVLRLVTCSGVFDRGEQRYSHNLVVYATLKEDFSSETSW